MNTETEYSDWMPMDEPVGEWFKWGGPDGAMEFDAENNRWRMTRPNGFGDKVRRINAADQA